MTKPALPRAVWVLGGVSLLMDVSSEMIHGLLPIFMVTVLGASALAVGVIEGIAEATAQIVKVFSGAISDRFGRRKPLTLAGYALAGLTKPLFAIADSLLMVLGARFADRIGKGIRGAPRDALIADIVAPDQRGSAFGLRQSLDTVGAFVGPLLAIGLMLLSGNNFQFVFWLAVVPACLAVGLLLWGVQEPERTRAPLGRLPLTIADARRLGRDFWRVTILAAVFGLARFSEAFLILRAQGEGLDVAYAPIVLVVMNVVYAVIAFPAGLMSDRVGRRGLLIAAGAVLVAADIVLAFGQGLILAFAGIVLWGAHMGLSQGLFAAMVADEVPEDLRGTAYGVFNFVGGIVALCASALAGLLWTVIGPAATFAMGAACAATAVIGLLVSTPRPGQ